MKRHVAVLAMLVGLIQMPVLAADWYFDFAYADGGDTLADVSLIDNNGDTSSDEVTAGGGPSFSFGLVHHFSDEILLQGSYGYKEEAVRADNGTSSFKRMTLDVLAFWQAGSWRVGAGFSKEMSPKLHVKFSSADTSFDDATGKVFEVGYQFTESFVLGLRKTIIDYDVTVSEPGFYTFDTSVNGDNWSLRGAFIF